VLCDRDCAPPKYSPPADVDEWSSTPQVKEDILERQVLRFAQRKHISSTSDQQTLQAQGVCRWPEPRKGAKLAR
jgi:hypothetical protein